MTRRAREIPEDVWIEILLRLPVKSLCRFRSVSASWNSVLSDPYFICSHYDRLESTSTKFLLRASNPARSSFFWPIPRGPPSWDFFTCGTYGSEPVPPAAKVPNCSSRHPPSPSVRGLICFPTDAYDICVLNPSTREYVSIPRPQPTRANCVFHDFLFGFDPVANKHKVIYLFKANDTYLQEVTERWVFTLGSVEKWRRIRVLGYNNYPYHSKCDYLGEVCIHGLIYFVLQREEYYNWTNYYLVEFDLRSGSSRMVNLSILGPHPFHKIVHRCRLIELDGSVALVDSDLYESTGSRPTGYSPLRINLWVLADFHRQAWDLKRSVFAPDSWSEIMPLHLGCALRRGEVLVFMPNIGVRHSPSLDLFFCNVESNSFWTKRVDLPVGIVSARGILCDVRSDHIESLLTLNGSYCDLDRHKEYQAISRRFLSFFGLHK